MKRTHLPLNGLRVLDAAARHLSFTRAADELAVTPAAVGQQIRALEDMLGVVLFRRTPKGLELTPEAESGLDALRSGFLMFEESVQAMQAGQSSLSLTIAAPRDMTARWLQPRLATYSEANPNVHFVLLSADEGIDFSEANLDLALRLTDGPGDLEGVRLADPLFARIEATSGSPDRYIEWPGAPHDAGDAHMRVADAGLAINGVRNGLGWAMVPLILAQGAINDGWVRQVGDTVVGSRAYWLVAPLPQWRQKKVKALVEALTAGE